MSDAIATTALTWMPASIIQPDADITVLCWLAGSGEWFSGWWDGLQWSDAATGGALAGVTHWAEPEGPAC